LFGLTEAGWWLRPVQGLVVVAGVAMIAWRMRGTRIAIAAVPLAAALLRVATDPLARQYYWYPAAVASLLLVAMTRRWLLAVAPAYAVLLGASVSWPLAAGPACLVLLLAVTARRSSAPAAALSTAAVTG